MSLNLDSQFVLQTQLLLRIAAPVFAARNFALKGGTAINLFLSDMPRVSVDIDGVYLNRTEPWDVAMKAIHSELNRVVLQLRTAGMNCRLGDRSEDATCNIESNGTSVKVEINKIGRGTLLPPVSMTLCEKAADFFDCDLTLPLLAPEEIYAGKFMAALSRQHPRDLYDVREFFRHKEITPLLADCFVAYLLMGKEPLHEALFSPDNLEKTSFTKNTEGMLLSPCSWDDLLPVRHQLQFALIESITEKHKQFLLSFVNASPDFSLMTFPHLKDMPSVKWKLKNLRKLKSQNPEKFQVQASLLERGLNDGKSIIENSILLQ